MAKQMNKKSQTPMDAILFAIFLFALAIGALFATHVFGQVFTGLENSTMNSSVTYPVFEKGRAVSNMWDFILLSVFIGFALAVVILGYFIDVHSIFMPIYIIGLIIGVVLSFILSYVWQQIIAVAPLSTTVLSIPITNNLLTNLPLYFTIIGALGMIATYAKVNQ